MLHHEVRRTVGAKEIQTSDDARIGSKLDELPCFFKESSLSVLKVLGTIRAPWPHEAALSH